MKLSVTMTACQVKLYPLYRPLPVIFSPSGWHNPHITHCYSYDFF